MRPRPVSEPANGVAGLHEDREPTFDSVVEYKETQYVEAHFAFDCGPPILRCNGTPSELIGAYSRSSRRAAHFFR
jgi:hypothetical protein